MKRASSLPSFGVHVHAPKPLAKIIRVLWCPSCRKRRRVMVSLYEWYGPSATCDAKRRRWKNIVKPCGHHWNFER